MKRVLMILSLVHLSWPVMNASLAAQGQDVENARQALARHQGEERRELIRHQRREREVARERDVSRQRLARHQKKERDQLLRHQKMERERFSHRARGGQ